MGPEPCWQWQPPHKNMGLIGDLFYPFPGEKRKYKKGLGLCTFMDVNAQDAVKSSKLAARNKGQFCVLAAPLSSPSLQEENQGLQRMLLQKVIALKAP